MEIKASRNGTGVRHSNEWVLSTLCPYCMTNGRFLNYGVHDLEFSIKEGRKWRSGFRLCPSPNCNGHVVFVAEANDLLWISPPPLLPFNRSDIPDNIADCFVEALKCHSASCYTATAIMLRKTVELLCDHFDASGRDLHSRISLIAAKISLSPELVDGMQILRMLGNDAAHVKAKMFESIGNKELEVAVKVIEKIMEAAFQHKSLVAKLHALRVDV